MDSDSQRISYENCVPKLVTSFSFSHPLNENWNPVCTVQIVGYP